jgi:hypothetical protein
MQLLVTLVTQQQEVTEAKQTLTFALKKSGCNNQEADSLELLQTRPSLYNRGQVQLNVARLHGKHKGRSSSAPNLVRFKGSTFKRQESHKAS